MKLPNGEHAVIPPGKLDEYCLNVEHETGGHKARVFRAALKLTMDDIDELHHKLLAVAAEEDTVFGITDEYGTRYIIDFEMTREVATITYSARVRSTWIIRIGELIPRLTSCYVP